jgi:hypothetical protein
LHLALDTSMLWNRICVVVVSVVCHGRAIPLLWQTLEHPSAGPIKSLLKNPAVSAKMGQPPT